MTSGPAIVARTYVQGSARLAKSAAWNNVKWRDYAPFIGGDVITNGHGHCTTGLPAVRIRDGRPVMVTAAHCFPAGQRIYTAAGTTWSWHNRLRGNYVGTVTSRNSGWDGELMVGAGNNADESDVNRWIPLTSVRYSYVGDYVCQSGAGSASLGHSTPADIYQESINGKPARPRSNDRRPAGLICHRVLDVWAGKRPGGLEPVDVGHPDVEQAHVRSQRTSERHRLATISGLDQGLVIRHLLDAGVDAIITDRPDLLNARCLPRVTNGHQ